MYPLNISPFTVFVSSERGDGIDISTEAFEWGFLNKVKNIGREHKTFFLIEHVVFNTRIFILNPLLKLLSFLFNTLNNG